MLVHQAVYTSALTPRGRGYHLVACSSGIGPSTARQLSQWSPSHGSLITDHSQACSLNFHPLSDDQLAISRTFCGGPEYSARGGWQVITHSLVLDRDQLRGFRYNAACCLRTVLSLGCLRLRGVYPPRLPELEIPDRWISTGHPPAAARHVLRWPGLADCRIQPRIALIWPGRSLDLVDAIVGSQPEEDRCRFSFATGLRPSLQRPFWLHVFPAADRALRRRLAAYRIRCLDVPAETAERSGPSTDLPAAVQSAPALPA
jgi:hypothetical protein